MQKDLLKLALAGLAAGLCVSAHAGSEIAMTKCTKSSAPKQQQSQDMDNGQGGQSSCGSSSEMGACGNSGGENSSCSNSCGSQGDQSQSDGLPEVPRRLEIRRLSAAKAVLYEEEVRNMDK